MGSLDRRLEKLEGRIEPAEDSRRSEITEELKRREASFRRMSPEEQEAWRNSPEGLAEREALEAIIRRRRYGA
jgi:hypothetical protein